MFIAAISLTLFLVPVAIFFCVAAMVWVGLDIFNGTGGRAEERLDQFSDRRRKSGAGGANDTKKDVIARAFEKATPSLSKPLTPTTELAASKLKQRLVETGFRSESAPTMFLAVKMLTTIVVLAMSGSVAVLLDGLTTSALIKTGIGAGIGFYLPELVLMYIRSKRKQAVFYGLPDVLDLMVVCVEAGLGLDQALRKVAEEMKKSHRVLADEFGLSNLHLQMGRAKNLVLQDLGNRNGVEDLRVLAALLIQADKFGTSVAQALRTQSDSMRVKRQQVAEEKAAKTAVKLIFPLVIFIFPGVFAVLVGPAAIQMVNEMFPAMQGK
jgi:tight adherence protein C